MQNNNNKSNNNQAIWKCKYLPWRLIQLTAIHKHPLPFLKWLTSLLPPRLTPVPLLVEVIVCLSCLLAFSVCLFVSRFSSSFVRVFCKNVHIIAFNINCHPNSKLSGSRKTNKPKNIPRNKLGEKLDRECWPDRQTFYGLLVYCLFKALPSLSEWQLLAYNIYAHVANASLCFGPCVPGPHF